MNKTNVATLLSSVFLSTTVLAVNQDQASLKYVETYIQSQIASIPVGPTYTAGQGITITDNVISATEVGAGTLSIGQYYNGGVIFWLDPTSTSTNPHGLIADIVDQHGTFQWDSQGSPIVTNATKNQAYAGNNSASGVNGNPAGNTYTILSSPDASTAAAALACANSRRGGYMDWYLPSIMELALMFAEQMTITQTALQQSGGGAFATINTSSYNVAQYWSSTEFNANSNNDFAWYFDFTEGYQYRYSKVHQLSVRCVRAF